MERTVFTIGHSVHPLEEFIALLKGHGINALCDVRSKPYSRVNPQFNREQFKSSLSECGIAYVFLGNELGARSEDRTCYIRGKIQYDLLARTALFQKGLDRVCKGIVDYRLALMCAEADPLECHRAILIARYLETRNISVQHILADGRLEQHREALSRLLMQLHIPEQDMFRSSEEATEEAYRVQGERIAYQRDNIISGNGKPNRSAPR